LNFKSANKKKPADSAIVFQKGGQKSKETSHLLSTKRNYKKGQNKQTNKSDTTTNGIGSFERAVKVSLFEW
jgi:hypothetical protein